MDFFDPKIVLESGTTDRYGFACLNPDGSLIGSGIGNTLYTQLIDYVSGLNPIYVGEAISGSLGSEANPIWRIKKLTYDVNNNITSVTWSGGVCAFTNIRDNRASLIYS